MARRAAQRRDAARSARRREAAREARARELIALVGLADAEHRYPRELPAGCRGAHRSRACWPAIRRCCCSTNRSARSTRSCAATCSTSCCAWQGSGKTIVFVTHDIDEALLLADRVIALQRAGGSRSTSRSRSPAARRAQRALRAGIRRAARAVARCARRRAGGGARDRDGEASALQTRRTRAQRTRRRVTLGADVLLFVVVVALWQLGSDAHLFDPGVVPSPARSGSTWRSGRSTGHSGSTPGSRSRRRCSAF